MAQGTVKWFNGDEGVRLHRSRWWRLGCVRPLQCDRVDRLYKSLDEGQRVEFETTQGPRGQQAEKVRPI